MTESAAAPETSADESLADEDAYPRYRGWVKIFAVDGTLWDVVAGELGPRPEMPDGWGGYVRAWGPESAIASWAGTVIIEVPGMGRARAYLTPRDDVDDTLIEVTGIDEPPWASEGAEAA